MDATQLLEAGYSPLAVKLLADAYKKRSPGQPFIFEHGDVTFAMHESKVEAGEGLLYLSREGENLACEVHMAEETDPAFWGLALADIAKHIALAMLRMGMSNDVENATKAIVTWMLRELDHPTAEPEGGLVT